MDMDRSSERELLVVRMTEDLVGPRSSAEVLADRPTDTYLTGILWPQRTAMLGEDDDSLAAGAGGAADQDETEAAAVPATSVQKPSVAGVSFCVAPTEAPTVDLTCSFGRYRVDEDEGEGPASPPIDGPIIAGGLSSSPGATSAVGPRRQRRWKRSPVEITIPDLALVPGSRFEELGPRDAAAEGVRLHIRCIDGGDRWLVTISLVNAVVADEGREGMEAAALFQTSMCVRPVDGTLLVPRPARRGAVDPAEHADESSASLLFRNAHTFATGHTCSAEWQRSTATDLPSADWVRMSWLPSVVVPGVSSSGHRLFDRLRSEGDNADPLSARSLAEASGEDLLGALNALCDCYGDWIVLQRSAEMPGLDPDQLTTATANLEACDAVLRRMRSAAAEICGDDDLRHAFQLANHVMYVQHSWDREKARSGELRWRPFQLAFLLLSAPSAVVPDHADRGVMDLLWFPTGGGKTEAYLALIAFVAMYRRLRTPAGGDGVSALMRYTLRLLTTQQFARSAAMILACEAVRSGRLEAPHSRRLRSSPAFSIGLWVGSDASPNSRAAAWASLQGSREVSSPKQLAKCPCCRNPIRWSQASVASKVIASCTDDGCVLKGELPVWTVDQDVYHERPTLVIGTVDKFAQIVRQPMTNSLFDIGNAPPDLIIQDELHLISGPLGTVAGTYEAAFDMLFSSGVSRPKIIGSTATIRRAAEQIRDLFDRSACQFPPPGVNQEDSGFAVRNPNAPGRRYVGVTTAGRSAKFTLQSVAASLLQSAEGGLDSDTLRNPYFTLVGYFNSLRELGGALVLMQDDVTDAIKLYAEARGEEVRQMRNVEELTSRRTQDEVLQMLEKLEIAAGSPGVLDAVLATNMVSVGVDIPRLGLMVVNGQPKTISEYIQATSRVGRGDVSGLVLAVLNNAKARDRSHFETFVSWHDTIYRDVEATSVTPFASRARDKALHAALVAAVRHLAPGMLDRPALTDEARARAEDLIDRIVERARRIDPEEREVRAELETRFDRWSSRGPVHYWNDFKDTQSLLQSAERAAWKKALGREAGKAWPTLNSMRTVEAGTPFRMAPVLRPKGTDRGE
ncbi:Helicase conserved C-terminal domain-containing protein [Sphingobium sp. YR657]|uniref:helicase-related protein n=1 Tax=Sphingobium sp. YR657 TaxID=1884366 RepID=UPI000910BC02|nr:helicase-related protein [Sphingobium sp. YR657]SHL52934.1 Helicase conserved C-terminal domain-containing protein [Sphingobium sp. YR657]